MNIRFRARGVLLMLPLLVAGCGYHLSGTGVVVPEGARAIAVPVFLNMTNEPYVDIEVTEAVVNEFLADGRLRIVGTEEADLVLRGKVLSFEVMPLSYAADSYVQQYRVLMKVDAFLEDRRSGTVVWLEKNIDSNLISSYQVTIGSIRDTKTAKAEAVRKASQDIAWTIRSRVLEGF